MHTLTTPEVVSASKPPLCGTISLEIVSQSLRVFNYEPRGLIVNFELFHHECFSHCEAHSSTSA
eukprot:5386911-Prymnesium_polylepis.1